MKKIIALLLVASFLFSMVSCNLLPALNNQETTPAETTPEVTTPAETTAHVHNFVVSKTESKAAKCETAGLEVSICACGAREEKEIEALEAELEETDNDKLEDELEDRIEELEEKAEELEEKLDD